MSLETMTKIATYTVPTGGVASYTFSNIPQTYTDLVVKVSARTTASEEVSSLNISLNGSSVLFTGQYHVTNGGGTFAGTATGWVSYINGATSTASIFSNSEIIISNYSSNHYKTITSDSTQENNGSTAYMGFLSNVFTSTSPVTTINFAPSSGNFAEFSTFTLYGVKSMRTLVGSSIKATGGAISTDGTHVYHTYGSTSTFLPTTNVMADVLVIAGGGGSSHGGGGAGGLLYYSAQTLTPQSYVITVGAGGAAGVSASANGSNGSNSQFGSLTACVGGGGGAQYGASGAFVGNSGGSGGGGGARDTNSQGNGGERVAGQGNTGGFASDALTPGAVNGGGGGGIGSAGGVATNTNDARGNAGAGTAAYSAWGLATGTGHNVGGTVYYAAGGRGSRNFNYGTSENGSAGLTGRPTTGGGADANTAVGGSGVVIIRYKA